MINNNVKLTILHDDNGTITDYSREMVDFARDQTTITFTTGEDYLYIGYYKPIRAVYVGFDTANINSSILTTEYYNGTAYAALSEFVDETSGLARSGFLQWANNQTDQAVSTINSVEQYWYRLSIDVTTSSMIFDGINIIFSDDIELKREFFEILDFLPSGANSHILTHESARNDIVQEMRRNGRYKESLATADVKDIDAFDFLEIEQIRQAATYLALSKIFFNVSDDQEGHYADKARHYRKKHSTAMELFYLNLDRDDDGISDDHEELASDTFRMVRR